jgi:EAL domain-containing protein (putative c-di-GMP-specific phosphodiesterase class I)
VTFAVVFVVCFLCLERMPRWIAKRHLSEQGETMARGFDDAFEAAHRDLMKLPDIDHLNCKDGASPSLGLRVFDNDFVRWFGVAREGKIICGSPILQFDLPREERRYRMSLDWSAGMSTPARGGQQLLVMERRGDLEYIAMLDPLIFGFQNLAGCVSCVTYEGALGRKGEVRFGAGATADPVVISVEYDAMLLTTPAKLTYSATKAYVAEFNRMGEGIAVGISAAAGLVFGLWVYALLVRRASLAHLLRRGIRNNEFVPFYQPIVDARDGNVLGAEVLARWNRKGRMISPGLFIQYAEDNDLIEPITEQIIGKVLVDIKELGWVGSDKYISINAVPDQITHSGFCDYLVAKLAESGVPGKNIAVELTERRQLADLTEGRKRLLQLVEAGVDVKIDDAGTGFGGFSYVQELPVHTLKIDKMFVDTLRSRDDAKRPVLDAIIDFAKASGLETIAEGVETQEQVDHLLKSGVHAIQGYVYAQPMPVAELRSWMAAGKARVPAAAVQ